MPKTFLLLGAINTLLCIALGAFGSHGLKHILTSEAMTSYLIGVQYHFYHALGLLIVGLTLFHFPQSRLIQASGWLMLLGIILFSVSIYILNLTGIRTFSMVAPFGGISFITAWAIFAVAIWKES